MSSDIKALRDEYSSLHSEATKVVDRAKTAKRNLNSDEKALVDGIYKKLDTIKAEVDLASTAAARAFANGDIRSDEPQGKADYDKYSQRSNGDIAVLRPSESFAKAVKAAPVTFGLGDYCRAMVLGARTEAEHFALARNGTNVPEALSAAVIDATRTGSTFIQAGATTVALTDNRNRIARLTDNADPSFRAESANVNATKTFEGVTFAPKTIAVIVKIPRELADDSLNVNEAVQTEFAIAFANELDRVCGWGAGGTEPSGIRSVASIQSVASAANGDSLATAKYGKLLEGLYQLHLKGTEPNAVLLSPREMKTLNGLADTTGQPLAAPASLAALRYAVSPSTPINETMGTSTDASTIIMGRMSDLWIAVRSAMTIELLREKYADTLDFAFLGTLRVDTAVVRPKSFVKLTGIRA